MHVQCADGAGLALLADYTCVQWQGNTNCIAQHKRSLHDPVHMHEQSFDSWHKVAAQHVPMM